MSGLDQRAPVVVARAPDAHADGFLRRGAAGFTLIELLVALSMAAVVLTSAMTAVTFAMRSAQRGRAERALVREGEFASVVLQRTLERAGSGVPEGLHLDDGAPNPPRAVVVAGADNVGVLADFPRPHAQYATQGTLASRPGGNKQRFSFHTENNGTCVPNTDANSCSIADASFFFPGDTTPCLTTAHFQNRTCPWGLRRLEPTDHVQLVLGRGGAWTTGRVNGTAGTASAQATVGGFTFLNINLAAAYADATNQWPNAALNDAPAGTPGNNFVVTLDRIFFRYDAGNRRLERAQCWGNPLTNAAWWPPEGNALPGTISDTANGRWCTPWEIILRDVDNIAFNYFDLTNNPTATLADIRRIDFTLVTSRQIAGTTVRYVVTGSAPIAKGTD